MDIIKAKNDQDTNNGKSIIKTGSYFQTLDTSKDTEPDFNILQNFNNINFDDPNYYWLKIISMPTPTPTPSITPSITPTISLTPSITPTISLTSSITPTASVTPTITPSITITSSSTTPIITPTPTQTPSIIQSLFLASISNGTTNARSSDGSSWTYGNFNNSRNWTDLTYGNNTFVAIGTGAISLTSTNGITWTQRSINNNNWNNIIFNS